MGVTVYLGNHQVHERIHVRDENGQYVRDEKTGQWKYDLRTHEGKRRTTCEIPDDWDLRETLAGLSVLWGWHSAAPKPAWVAATDPTYAATIGAAWGIPVRDVDLDHQPTPTEG